MDFGGTAQKRGTRICTQIHMQCSGINSFANRGRGIFETQLPADSLARRHRKHYIVERLVADVYDNFAAEIELVRNAQRGEDAITAWNDILRNESLRRIVEIDGHPVNPTRHV